MAVMTKKNCWSNITRIILFDFYYRNIEPKWVIHVLAGTYWRIFGHPQNGIQCFRWALSAVPKKYEDVVLTNLAGMYVHGHPWQYVTIEIWNFSKNS